MNCKIFEYFSSYAKPKLVVNDAIVISLDKDNPESDRKYFKSLSKLDNLIVGFMPKLQPWQDI